MASGGDASAVNRLSADAPAFVPGGGSAADGAVSAAPADEDDVLAQLPQTHKMLLRTCFQAPTGEWIAYYVGRLKSFNNRTGYGFLACSQCKTDFGNDVFIHKGLVPSPWTIGQPLEFAVQMNSRGQPQAFDVNWLPRIMEARPMGGARPGGCGYPGVGGFPGVGAGAGMGAGDAVRPRSSDGGQSDAAAAAGPRYIGTLKSYSTTQGYGFVACEDLSQHHQRDTYLDRSQLPPSGWRIGMFLEFGCSYNARGHPQARLVNVDPFPMVGDSADTAPGAAPYNVGLANMEKFKALLKLVNENQFETAVITAIDSQGTASKAAEAGGDLEKEADFVSYVLDRVGPERKAAATMKDFVKMLLLLMVAKMFRAKTPPGRCRKLVSWFTVLASSIDETAEDLKDHLRDVCEQIYKHLEDAREFNASLGEGTMYAELTEAARTLQEKATGTSTAAAV